MAIDANGNTVVFTLADMASEDMKETYGELHKDLCHFFPSDFSPATMLQFFNTYDARFAEQEAEEAEQLKRLGERDGVEYRSWTHFYADKEAKMEAAYEREAEERAELAAQQAEYVRRGSPMPVIDAWEHGSL